MLCYAVHLRCDRRGDFRGTGLVGRNSEEEKKWTLSSCTSDDLKYTCIKCINVPNVRGLDQVISHCDNMRGCLIVYGAKESIPPAYVARRAGTKNSVVVLARHVGNRICKPLKVPRESIPSLAGRCENPICCTGPPGYIGWRNRFLGSIKVYKYGLGHLQRGLLHTSTICKRSYI